MLLAAILSTLATSGALAVSPPVITIHAKEYAFVAPRTVKSGPVTFRLVNDGKELHHLTIVKLGGGHTLKDFSEAMKKPGPPPEWTTDVGGPNPALPGGGSVDATLSLEPGEYAMLCFIPSPGSPMPHVMKGMAAPLTVLPDNSGATAPTSDVNIRLSDYKFTLSKPLTAGKHVISVDNDATQSHELVIVKLNKGKTIADVATWVDKELMKGPPPGTPIGGMSAISKGRTGTFPVNLAPGTYGIICFVPDIKDAKAHSQHGMTMQVEVK